MKKILLAMILGLAFFPVTATAQKWVDSHVKNDGTYVEGHWESPKDSWQRQYSRPGAVNPLTGQFNTYYSRDHLKPPHPTSSVRNSSEILGSSAPNPYAIPGSSAPNPYAIPGSNPKSDAPHPSTLYHQGSHGSGR